LSPASNDTFVIRHSPDKIVLPSYKELRLKDLSFRLINACNSIAPPCQKCSKKMRLLKVISKGMNERGEDLLDEYYFRCGKCKNIIMADLRPKG